MKTRKALKCFMAMMIMVMAFSVTNLVANATEATYTPTSVTDLSKDPGINQKVVTVQPGQSVVIPIQIPGKGGIDLAYTGQKDTSGYNLYTQLYADPSCTSYYGYIGSMYPETSMYRFDFEGPTTCYLKIENRYSEVALQGAIAAWFYNGADRTLTSGQTTAVYQNDYTKPVLHKFKASATGYITVNAATPNDYGISITLLSSKKKALSNKIYTYSKYQNVAYFAVEKGKTYYLSTSGSEKIYNLRYKLTKVKEKSGSKQSKAVTIKKNKTVKGLQLANGKTSGKDYYKIKLTKKQKLTIYIEGRSTSDYDLKVKVIPANKRMIITGSTMYVPRNGKGGGKSKDKFPAGTYYLEVSKYNKKSSGYYTIKWK